jgi:CPA2 family monovalent cation:H+ antiporter-2
VLHTLVYEVLVILASGLAAGLICRRIGVPMLTGYMLVGILVGSGALGLIREKTEEIEHLAELGVFLLLFAIGLEFSLEELLRLGRHLVLGGSVQMVLVAVPAAVALRASGFDWSGAGLLAAAVAFSSTVLVFKTLAEWGYSSSPAGRRAIGILLFQDAALVPLLLFVPLLSGAGPPPSGLDFVVLVLKSLLFLASVVVMRQLLAGWLMPVLSGVRSLELFVLATVVILGGATFASHTVGLPPAIGAFVAGLMLGGNRWTRQIDALVLPFRETFAAVFFVSMGLLFDPGTILDQPLYFLAVLAGLIVLKTAAACVALRLTGLGWRDSLYLGLGLAHVGEFAFVVAAIGMQAGLFPSARVQPFLGVSLASLMLLPALLNHALQRIGSPSVDPAPSRGAAAQQPPTREAIVVGAGLVGRQIASRLETMGHDVCVIDLSPVNLLPFAQQGFRTVAGDASDPRILDRARAERAQVVIVGISQDMHAVAVVRHFRQRQRHCRIIVRCRFQANVPSFFAAGADQVVSEEAQAGAALLKLLPDQSLDAAATAGPAV